MSKKIGKATRPVFIPNIYSVGVTDYNISFDWHMGMSKAVKQRSIISLHEKAKEKGYTKILEASSKSQQQLGINLSAFFLKDDKGIPVENLFQSSKVFQSGHQFLDLLNVSPREAKKDPRLRNNGEISKFHFNNTDFPLEPKSLFYDWLYTNILFNSTKNDHLKKALINSDFDAFSDIEFNPKKSFSCQARTLALCISLFKNRCIDSFIENPVKFSNQYNLYSSYSMRNEKNASQLNLF